jgi:hypothetical protein
VAGKFAKPVEKTGGYKSPSVSIVCISAAAHGFFPNHRNTRNCRRKKRNFPHCRFKVPDLSLESHPLRQDNLQPKERSTVSSFLDTY